jgi:hypothetical protein
VSEPLPDYQPCEVELEFGDGSYLFKLNVKNIAELQEKCGAGIGEIYGRILSGAYRLEDLTETVRLGLIGGGIEGPAARKLIERYTPGQDTARALEWWHKTAYAVIAACIHGYQPPPEEGDVGEKKTNR